MRSKSLLSLLPGIVFIVLIVAALEYATQTGLIDVVIFPQPSRVGRVLVDLVANGAVAAPLFKTLGLLFAGYGIATVVGVTLGILMGVSKPVFDLFEPLVELMRPLPKPALLPPLILLLGLGSEMKIAIVSLGAVFPILIATLQGARAVDPILIDVARTFGVGRLSILWRIVLRASMPFILSGMKISLGIGLVLVILAEMLANTGGLGGQIISMQRSFELEEMYAWVVLLSAVGVLLVVIFNLFERRLSFWNRASAAN